MSIIICACTTPDGRGCRLDETYRGAVLALYERAAYDHTDFIAVVWDARLKQVVELEWRTTRYFSAHNKATVDPTVEVRDAALAWWREQHAEALLEAARNASVEIRVGRRVQVWTNGQPGPIGLVKWMRAVNDGDWQVGISPDDSRFGPGLRYFSYDDVEVVTPDVVDETALRLRAAAAQPPDWPTAFAFAVTM